MGTIYLLAIARFPHLHSVFIVWAKKNLQYKCIRWRRRMPRNVLTDSEIMLTDYITSRKYKEKLKLVKFYDEKQGREFLRLPISTRAGGRLSPFSSG